MPLIFRIWLGLKQQGKTPHCAMESALPRGMAALRLRKPNSCHTPGLHATPRQDFTTITTRFTWVCGPQEYNYLRLFQRESKGRPPIVGCPILRQTRQTHTVFGDSKLITAHLWNWHPRSPPSPTCRDGFRKGNDTAKKTPASPCQVLQFADPSHSNIGLTHHAQGS